MPNFDIKKHLFEIEQLNKYKAMPYENKTVPEDDGTKSSTIKQRINPEQLKNIVLYNDGNKEHPKTQREELTKNIIESNVQKNEDSALEILAQQNRGVLTTKGNFGNMRNTYGSEHFTIFGENITAESKYAERANHNSSTGENEGTTVTFGGNENNGNGTETITDNWEGKQKYTHEYIKSLNIGISVETFQQILSDFFENPRIIDGKLTYVLKSGTISQVTDLIAQIYVAERLSSTPDYIPDPPEEDKGYALLDKDTYNDRRANYYYMCYMNGIPFDGHEFENGTYDRDIARACGLYEYENVFENYMMDENVQKYLQENFGITISLPPSEEYADLWNKLANLAAMDETGNNTGEYNKQNVLKYFGLALTDSAFMEFVDKASYVQQEENPVRNCSFDIEAVKDVINEKYPGLLEEGNLSDEMLEWIGSNAMVFMLLNKNLLRAGDIQDYVNYGNIPSWVTMNNGQEFNEDLLLKCCIEAMAKLADMGQRLGYDPKEFVNRNLAEEVEKMYLAEVEKLNSPQVNYAPRMGAPINELPFPDYVMDFLIQKYGDNISFEQTSYGDISVIVNGKIIGEFDIALDYNYFNEICLHLSEKYCEGNNFYGIYSYTFENGRAVPDASFEPDKFLNTYYSEMQLPPEMREYFKNGENDFYEYLRNLDFNDLQSIMSTLMAPDLTGRGESSGSSWELVEFFEELRSTILSDENMYSYLYDTIAEKLQQSGYSDLLRLLPPKEDTSANITYLYDWYKEYYSDSTFVWNADGIIINNDVKQGGTGDCWFISSMISMSNHPEIVQLLKDHCLQIDDENRTYTVTVQGKTFTYTFDEILRDIGKLSTGDVDLVVLEKAAREYFGLDGSNPIARGGSLGDLIYFLTGEDISEYYDFETQMRTILEHINDGDYISTFGIDKGAHHTAIDSRTGEAVELEDWHEYSVVGVDNEYLYIINPWDSSKILKLSLDTIRNNPGDFDYSDIRVDEFSKAIQNANSIILNEIRENLENGSYFDENGDFDYNKYYEDCAEFGMNPNNLDFIFRKTQDENGSWISRLEMFNPDGSSTVITRNSGSGQVAVIEIGIPRIIQFGDDPRNIDLDNYTDIQLLELIPELEDFITMYGTLDREALITILPKFCESGIFDREAFSILLNYYKSEDGKVDNEKFTELLSNFNSYSDIENFAKAVQQFERVQLAQQQNNMLAGIEALKDWVSGILSRLKNSGSIYSGTDYWGMTDVFWNPYASAQDVENAINMMRAMQNAAKQLGMTLDQYLSLSPSQREHYQGMLTTPLPIDYYLLTEHYDYIHNNYYGGGENENNTYYSTPNQSSIISAPDWFKDLIANGNYPNMDEIQNNLIFGTASEEEGKLYDEFYKFNMWCYYNNGLTDNLSSIELYNLYTLDMTFFFMWMNTEAILLGYSPDDSFETLYEAYQKNNKFF